MYLNMLNYSEKVNSAIINPKEKRFRTKSHIPPPTARTATYQADT